MTAPAVCPLRCDRFVVVATIGGIRVAAAVSIDQKGHRASDDNACVAVIPRHTSQQPILRIAIPALAGMTTLHALLLPHPGPLVAVSALYVDLGLTPGLGVIVALPTVILAGQLYGSWMSKRMHASGSEEMGQAIYRSAKHCRAAWRIGRGGKRAWWQELTRSCRFCIALAAYTASSGKCGIRGRFPTLDAEPEPCLS